MPMIIITVTVTTLSCIVIIHNGQNMPRLLRKKMQAICSSIIPESQNVTTPANVRAPRQV